MNANLSTQIKAHPHRLVGGILLITAGTGMLVGQFVDLGALPILLFGVVMLLSGILTRSAGWIIPGGIVSGLGSAVAVMESPFGKSLAERENGALFLVLFGLGFALVAIFSRIFTADKQDWAMIPAGVMAAIGGLIFTGTPGLTILEYVGKLWPVALILVGLGLLTGMRKK